MKNGKMIQDSTVYRMDELEEDEEEVGLVHCHYDPLHPDILMSNV